MSDTRAETVIKALNEPPMNPLMDAIAMRRIMPEYERQLRNGDLSEAMRAHVAFIVERMRQSLGCKPKLDEYETLDRLVACTPKLPSEGREFEISGRCGKKNERKSA